MTFRKCDHCGLESEADEKVWRVVLTEYDGSCINRSWTFDLCQSCNLALRQFIKTKERSNENPS